MSWWRQSKRSRELSQRTRDLLTAQMNAYATAQALTSPPISTGGQWVFQQIRVSASGIIIATPRSEPASVPELQLTFGTTPIVGYRSWKLDQFYLRNGEREWRLYPIASPNGDWTPRERISARCTNIPHEAPWPTCMCGLWALRDQNQLDPTHMSIVEPVCFGEVYLWGRVCEFKLGYRAQYAYPKRLLAVGIEPGALDHYGVPVHYAQTDDPIEWPW